VIEVESSYRHDVISPDGSRGQGSCLSTDSCQTSLYRHHPGKPGTRHPGRLRPVKRQSP